MGSESTISTFQSIKLPVEFLDVSDTYTFTTDLRCKYKVNDYTPQEGDRIVIFKFAWTSVKDYIVFEWVPVGSHYIENFIVFNKHCLPKNEKDLYQFCYISSENEMLGASTPFQFASQKPISENLFSYIPSINTDKSTSKDLEIEKLREENLLLKESLKALIALKNNEDSNYKFDTQIKDLQQTIEGLKCTVRLGKCHKCAEESCRKTSFEKDLNDLKQVTESLKTALTQQQREINMLKMKIREGGEEYKKLYIEKAKVERKYEKLKGHKEEKRKSSNCENDLDGDLISVPPFPSVNIVL